MTFTRQKHRADALLQVRNFFPSGQQEDFFQGHGTMTARCLWLHVPCVSGTCERHQGSEEHAHEVFRHA